MITIKCIGDKWRAVYSCVQVYVGSAQCDTEQAARDDLRELLDELGIVPPVEL